MAGWRGKVGRLKKVLGISQTSQPTTEKIDPMFVNNVLGPFVLINILLPLLESTGKEHGDVRVVVGTDEVYLDCFQAGLDFGRLMEGEKTEKERYQRSMLGRVLFIRDLARRLEKRGSEGVFVNCL